LWLCCLLQGMVVWNGLRLICPFQISCFARLCMQQEKMHTISVGDKTSWILPKIENRRHMLFSIKASPFLNSWWSS
jgi:hypothetical protein